MSHSDELSKLFAAERLTRAPAEAVERGVSRLLADLAVRVAPAPVAAGAVKATSLVISKWILAGFVVGVASSGVAARALAPLGAEPVRPAQRIEHNSKNVDRSASFASPQLETPTLASAESPATSSSAPNPVHPPSAVESGKPARFDAELRLLTLAKAEVDAGRPHLAKVWLAEHRARFPTGVFSSDRDALSVLADCAERPNESLARSFAARHPGSPMTERLLRACQSTESNEIDK